MLFALLLILSSLFFFSPLRGNAGKIPGEQLTTNIENCTTQTVDCFESDDCAVASINTGHRNIATSQFRFFTFNNFINAAGLKNGVGFSYEENLFAAPHLYCKKIGLKLLFPEHYFW